MFTKRVCVMDQLAYELKYCKVPTIQKMIIGKKC